MKHRNPPRDFFTRSLCLAAILAVVGHHAFHAEEEPGESFVHDRDESVLLITLTPPQGTVLETSGSTLPVEIFVERHSWEIWRRPSDGFEEARSSNSEPASGMEVGLSASPGTTGDLLVVTDGQGLAATTYTGGGVPGSATLTAAVGETSATLTFQPPGEDWTYQDTQATLAATLEAPEGATKELGKFFAINLALSYVGGKAFGFLGKGGAPAANYSEKFVLSGMTKADARAAIQGMGLPAAQFRAANSAIGRATSSSYTTVTQTGPDVMVQIFREGRNGYQVMESTIRLDGSKTVLQKAYDAAGTLEHLAAQFFFCKFCDQAWGGSVRFMLR